MNCKLTDENLRTFNNFQYELGIWVEADGSGNLCGPGWLHYYRSPLLAMLHAPIHNVSRYRRLFRVDVDGEQLHDCDLQRRLRCLL